MVANRKNRKNKNSERRSTDDILLPSQKRRNFTPPPGLGESDEINKFVNRRWFSQKPRNYDDTLTESEKLQKHWEQIIESSAFKHSQQNSLGVASTSSHLNELRIEIPPYIPPIAPQFHQGTVPLRHGDSYRNLNYYPPPPPVVPPSIVPSPGIPPIVPPPDAQFRHRDQEVYFDILTQIKKQEEQKQQQLQQHQHQEQEQQQQEQEQQQQEQEQQQQEQEEDQPQQLQDIAQMRLNADAAPFFPRTYFEKVFPSPPQTPNTNSPNLIQPPLHLEHFDPNNWEYLRARYSVNLADRNRVMDIRDDFRTCGFCNLYIAHKDLLREHVKAHHNDTLGYVNEHFPTDYEHYNVEPQTDYQKFVMNKSLDPHGQQNFPTHIYDEAVAQGRLRPYAVPINFMVEGVQNFPRYPAFNANAPLGVIPPFQNQRREDENK